MTVETCSGICVQFFMVVCVLKSGRNRRAQDGCLELACAQDYKYACLAQGDESAKAAQTLRAEAQEVRGIVRVPLLGCTGEG